MIAGVMGEGAAGCGGEHLGNGGGSNAWSAELSRSMEEVLGVASPKKSKFDKAC